MSERATLHARRAQLVARAARERAELAHLLGELQKPVRVVDRGLDFVRGLKRSPLFGAGVGVATAALAMLRPRGIADWLVTGKAVWQTLGEARRKAKRLSAEKSDQRS